MADPSKIPDQPPMLERRSLCLAGNHPGVPLHCDEEGFLQNLEKCFEPGENNVAEKIVQLKRELRNADTEAFWKRLMEGMTEICHAQYGFVAKRILTDDHDSAVEMPPIGEPGSCLLGVAFYYNDGDKHKAMHRDYKYMAWGAPCEYMKHDKVFLIPDQMSSFIPHNPNALPFPAEGYLAVPLFHEEKCFAHFGMMWTQEGLGRRDTSWGYTEMLLHSLEDIITERLVSGKGFAKPEFANGGRISQVIPQDAITPATQSLKPFARSLSHELRTPMQGVVGMLDVMHATVQEQIEGHIHPSIRRVFQTLKESIETVQDSAKRAVEAADNVVHAYDMNMQIPDTPQHDRDSTSTSGYFDYKPARIIEGSDIHITSYKRRRSSPTAWQFGNPPKIRNLGPSARADVSPQSAVHQFVPPPALTPQTSISEDCSPLVFTPMQEGVTPSDLTTPSTRLSGELDVFQTPGLKNCRIRDLIPTVIHESLRVGGRPDSAIGEPTRLGERIVARSRSSNGSVSLRRIEWAVGPGVPETLLVDERDLAKLISAVFLNAVKFTEDGYITIKVRLSENQRHLIVNVRDTGDGIPEAFQPELFKPFSREDDSLTRSKEGLGLGLLVAKGLARRIGGDINLVRSAVVGPDKGSEFEIKVPLNTDGISRAPSPSGRPAEALQSVARPSTASTPSGKSPSQVPTPETVQSTIPKPPRIPNLSATTKTVKDFRISPPRHPAIRKDSYDRNLAEQHPLTFLVAEDNKINRKLLVNMLGKLGYKDIHEAYDGKEAVRIMREVQGLDTRCAGSNGKQPKKKVDVILMDLWMPEMDGYQATECILGMFRNGGSDNGPGSHRTTTAPPIVLAVSADATEEAIERATKTGMEGFMTKPYKLADLQRLILEFCIKSSGVQGVS
ncbi:hypothetical protein ABEF95_002762 [Exophiala dermatitidis]|uniref:histidine kinase n=1 Tax=Exophiala dermatitidis (strain ATCC 34100 / CBS 525.76 / NIH/UT8656) TaxID=858893 RepID=H6BKZ9_EXODN|nr:two-component system, NarL family, sensor histidine kinase BarA [Exophiala dermatitidis NIH/UT8656]EHY51800.1 two-component system, NarL family, sensor histidine kinase BarA [Exophiala dermatitidis NIH/UT8656]